MHTVPASRSGLPKYFVHYMTNRHRFGFGYLGNAVEVLMTYGEAATFAQQGIQSQQLLWLVAQIYLYIFTLLFLA